MENSDPQHLNLVHHATDVIRPEIVAESYRQAVESQSHGPQFEGIDLETVEELVQDAPDRVVMALTEKGRLPLLFPVEGTDAISSDYVVKRYGPEVLSKSYFFSPSAEVLETASPQLLVDLQTHFAEGGVIFYEETSENDNKGAVLKNILEHAGLETAEDRLVDPKNGTEAAIIHYTGELTPTHISGERKYGRLRDVFEETVHPDINAVQNGVTFLDNEKFAQDKEMQEYIWELCNTQFSAVVENLPVRQSPTKEELIEIVSHPETSTLMYMQDGKPVTLCAFAHNLEACEWLRENYFEQQYPNEWLGYFVFLVTDANHLGQKNSLQVLNMVYQLTGKSEQPMRVVFECTNISADYIPYKVVEPTINSSGVVTIKLEEDARYTTKAMIVQPLRTANATS